MSDSNKQTVPFKGTKQQEEQLRAELKDLKSKGIGVMSALQSAQEIYGYLPKEVQLIVAEEMGVSLSEVYGVATFYSQFSLYPKGEYRVSVCLGTACYVKNAGLVFDKLKECLNIDDGQCTPDGKFSLDATRCVGCCGFAPVMMVNDDVYGKVTPEEVAGILAKY